MFRMTVFFHHRDSNFSGIHFSDLQYYSGAMEVYWVKGRPEGKRDNKGVTWGDDQIAPNAL